MSTAQTQHLVLRRSVRGLWDHLPMLLVASVAVCVVTTLVLLIAPGVTPLSTLLAAVAIAPSVGALFAVVDDVLSRDESRPATWVKALRNGAIRSITAVLPLAVSLVLTLVAVEVWRRTHMPVALAPVGVGGATTTLLVPVTVAVLGGSGLIEPGTSAGERWAQACGLVLRWPVRFAAAPALLVAGVWLTTQVTASIALLVPAPVAMIAGAALWTSAVEAGSANSIDGVTVARSRSLRKEYA
ncbi:hypothetical protein [Flexivirga meconopsidis]|uniref:hypothetical protein n=1 Tax=Flexivirga meconopsidis TaxID=2977121 RepID=UPI002240A0B1|nr:hypothetical protein [Flexivirga meconopsidis]